MDKKVEKLLIESAKETPEEERGLLKTLLALDVPFGRALSLVTDETTTAVKGTLAQYSWLIRYNRMEQFPEGSAVRRRLGMIADMLDPSGEDTWDYRIGTEEKT